MRKPMVIANWKMYKNHKEAFEFVNAVKDELPPFDKVESGVCAQSVLLKDLVFHQGNNLKIGAQNMYFEDEGAFTGEVSPAVLQEMGVYYTIIGHSERRKIFFETDEMINKKVISAFSHNLIPILCVGETLEERQNNKVNEILINQLQKGLSGIDSENVSKMVISYEPVWAINTGHSATPEIAEEVCSLIRKFITDKYGSDVSSKVRLLYGGSVKVTNFKRFLECENIDGALVGKETLDADNFLKIAYQAIE